MSEAEYQRPRRKRKRKPVSEELTEKKKSTGVKEDARPKRKKKKSKSQDDEPSTHKLIALVMLGIALFGWACAAAAYAHAKEGWRSNETERFADENGGDLESDLHLTRRRAARSAMIKTAFAALMDFIGNAFRQIPNFFSVVAFTFSERLWLVILFAVLEGAAVGLGYIMEKVGESFVDSPQYP
ncbi:hypothetical protein [Gimesia sp.]|uniref:hypothetical protein n=1 Tax=Gimesia sp. TaxID=2024833 RepID=UPI003A93F9B9